MRKSYLLFSLVLPSVIFASCFAVIPQTTGFSSTHWEEQAVVNELLPGQTFAYQVATASLQISFDNNEFAVTNYHQLLGEKQSASLPFRVICNNQSSTTFVYTLSCGSLNRTIIFQSSYRHYTILILSNLFQTFSIMDSTISDFEFTNNFSQTLAARGVGYPLFFFMPANETSWLFLQGLAENYTNLDWSDNFFVGKYAASYYEQETIAYLELYTKGKLLPDTENLKISTGLLFGVNKTSGVVMGYRFKTSLKGEFKGYKVTCKSELYLKREEFDLPELTLYQELKLVGGIGATVGVGLFMALVVFVRKRKQ
ncbi:MAG: hypothetical protein K9W42_07960 [Candidatus Heimdallarchaeota archaeon]|nr:hypothetical protein [Candidatus Heimdallarchaeota archaeon]